MRTLLLVAALVSVLFPAIAKAEVLAVCGVGETPNTASFGNAAALSMIAPRNTFRATSQLALWHDTKGFDVLLNWGQQNQLSLRAEGADIMGDEIDAGLIHLVVARAGANSLEHFLFSWDGQAVGELLWSAPDDAHGNDDDILSYQMACIKQTH